MRCKKKTSTSGAHKVSTSNGRHRLAGKCTSCGCNKSQMVGSGFLGSLFKAVAPVAVDGIGSLIKNRIGGSGMRKKTKKGSALF